MLQAIQTYITIRGTVSMVDLSRHFHTDAETLKPMLSRLAHRERIYQVPMPRKCGGCTACHRSDLEFYAWVDPASHASDPLINNGEATCCPQR